MVRSEAISCGENSSPMSWSRAMIPSEERQQLFAADGHSRCIDEQVEESSQLALLLLRLRDAISKREVPIQSP